MSENKTLKTAPGLESVRPLQAKSERTRQAILDSALQFLWTHPFRDLTVAGLMANTGASRSAFYQYFSDLHELMEALLEEVGDEIMLVVMPWFEAESDPVPMLKETLAGLVNICYKRGPILRAVTNAAAGDKQLERAWFVFMDAFDEAATNVIERHQAAGFIADFPAQPVAAALNRMDAAMMIDAFGKRPRRSREEVLEALTRIWVSTLYGINALGEK